MKNQDIYAYCKNQENTYETQEIQIGDNWRWNMRNHIQLLFHLKNGIFYTGDNTWLRAFKNIMEPILQLSYWTEDIDVKDVVFFMDEENSRVLSFLIKKYHDEVYVKTHNLDALFDKITESDIDYGGVLVQKGVDMPEVLPLKNIAFCDQTDILGGPVAFKNFFTPDKLRTMSKYGWGEEKNGATISLEDLCTLAESTKDSDTLSHKKNMVPSKSIEVYIIRGSMPHAYLEDSDDYDYYCNQLQIVAFYTKKDSQKQGVTLYRKEEQEGNLKFFTSKEVEDRALGRGIGESELHPQIWTNFMTIHKMGLIESAAKIALYTDDSSYTTKNKIQDMENLEITVIEDGKQIHKVPNDSQNIQLFDKAISEWYEQAQLAGSAFDPIMGKEPPSGTTFRGQERNVTQGRGSHDKRKGQRAKFIEELYRDYILPDITKEIMKGQTFLATLSTKELKWIAEEMAINTVNEHVKDIVLNHDGFINGKLLTNDDVQAMLDATRQGILKKGNKHLIEIVKGEFKDVEIKIGINVANKQKDLSAMNDKLLGVFEKIAANPQLIKIDPLMELFNHMIEYAGLPPVDFSGFDIPYLPARRMTETINYADLDPQAQQAMLQSAGIQVQPSQTAQPSPLQPNQPVK